MPNQPKIRYGRKWAIASLICALITLAVAPLIFGVVGMVAGMMAVVDGERWWGATGVTASGGALVLSFYIAPGLAA